MNMEHLANTEQIELCNSAHKLLKEIAKSIVDSIIPEKYLDNFNKINTIEQHNNIVIVINSLVLSIERLTTSLLKYKTNSTDTREKIKKYYNIQTNKLIGKLNSESELSNILLIDKDLKYISNIKKVNCPKLPKVDILDSTRRIGEDRPEMILHVVGGRCNFDSIEHLMSCLKVLIETRTTWSDLFMVPCDVSKLTYGSVKLSVNSIMYYFTMRINFFPSVLDNNSLNPRIMSNNSRLIHLLFGGMIPSNVSKTLKHLKFYPIYAEFIELIKKRIYTIINDSYNIDSCEIQCIPCCRNEPKVCECINICTKPKFMKEHKTNQGINCLECQMNLCVGGCGKPYHGNTPCDVSEDEQSELLIKSECVKCPNCMILTYKVDGCNHMKCERCNTHFCYLCAQQYSKDSYGILMINEHYNNMNSYDSCIV